MSSALVVDDSPMICRILSLILQTKGYTVQTVGHGGLALDILRRSREGKIVLLDLCMPRVDGRDVLAAVAEDEALAARHVIIMVTAAYVAATTGDVAALRNYLCVPLVTKPFKPQQIIDEVVEADQRLRDRQQGIWTPGGICIAANQTGES